MDQPNSLEQGRYLSAPQGKIYRTPNLVEYGEIWEITGGDDPGNEDTLDSGRNAL